MYALPRTPALHASPVLNSYFEHALTSTTRIMPSTRLASSSPATAFTVSSPKNTTTVVFRTTNRPGTPLYTPPLSSQSYFPTLPTVQDNATITPHNTPFFGNISSFSSSPKLGSAQFTESHNTIAEEDTTDLSSQLSGLGLGIGNLLESNTTVFPSAINNAPFTRKRQNRPSFAHRISNMPMPLAELCLPKMKRAASNVSTTSMNSECTVTAGSEEVVKSEASRPAIRWASSALSVAGRSQRKGTPHPGKMVSLSVNTVSYTLLIPIA